jgi:hypothetical protein
MSCGFINKYIDKLYLGDMSFFESKALKHHMESCDECRSIYTKITGGNSYIKEKVLDVDVPPSLTLNLSMNLGLRKITDLIEGRGFIFLTFTKTYS